MSAAKAEVIDVSTNQNKKKKAPKGLKKRLSQTKAVPTSDDVEKKQADALARRTEIEKNNVMPTREGADERIEAQKKSDLAAQGKAAAKKENAVNAKLATEKAKADKAATMGDVDGAKAKRENPTAQKDKKKADKDVLPATTELGGGEYIVPGTSDTIEVDLKKKTAKGKKNKALIKRLSKTKAAPTQNEVDKKQAEALARRTDIEKNDKVMPTDLEAAAARKAVAAPAKEQSGDCFVNSKESANVKS